MDDNAIEQQIQAKGLTAPRVTLADLNDNIIDTEIVKHTSRTGQVFRWAIITVINGFGVVGKPSVAVSPENDDAEIGERCAVENSRDDMWPLMGYALKNDLHRRAVFAASPKVGYATQPPVDNAHVAPGAEQFTAAEIAVGAAVPAYQQRVIDEFNELMSKAIKLREYTLAPTFQRLADAEQVRLGDQLVVMTSYADILQQRIAAF